jgi:hypothetical protein
MRQPCELSRRSFLKASGSVAAAVASLGACSLAATQAGQPQAAIPEPASTAPLSELDAFNYAVGTQTFSAAYQFTGKPRLLETAEAIREMGAGAIKFRLGEKTPRGDRRAEVQSLRDIASNDPVAKSIFSMPFGHYLLWAYPLGKVRSKAADQSARDEEVYDLCCHLLKAYNGTGKTFYLGHWEGDWELRGRAGSLEDPTPERIASKIQWLNRRQQAVDDAKRNTPHRGVEAFCYAEANLVRDAMQGRPAMANEVIPHTQIDFVSYSSYDTANGKNAETEVPKALDFIESKLLPKAAIKGKRVWIGEYGYPACNFSPQEQASRTRRLIKIALQWGCPFVLYWEMYNNEVEKDGKQRGFWLIDDQGVKQPVYYLHQRLLQWARGYVAEFAKAEHRLPTFDEYRKKAVAFLDADR